MFEDRAPEYTKTAPTQKPLHRKGWAFVVSALVLAVFLASCGSTEPNSSAGTEGSAPAAASQPEETLPDSSEAAEPQKDAAADSSVPTEYRSALNKAKDYCEYMYMSKTAIYDQLVSEYGEKFPADAAQYAIDHLDADWNANALKKGQSYAENMHMSKTAIYDQLVSEYGEKFTAEQAQYAVDNLDADWNANALEKARSYQETMDMSKAAIYDQLVSEYGEKFTAEQAQYAVDNLE